jgi:predicted lipoprotein with Yx(FWY)xxD motif
MAMRVLATFGAAVIGLATLGASASAASLKPLAGPQQATPLGIVIQVRGTIGGGGSAGRVAVMNPSYVLTNAKGMTLYVSDLDTQPLMSACIADCAVAWPPLVAPPNSKSYGDWGLAVRPDGSKQWAYKGKPLYTAAENKDSKSTQVADAKPPTADPKRLSSNSPVAQLLDNPKAKEVFNKYLPEIVANPQLAAYRDQSLRKLQPLSPNITDEALKHLDEDLAKLDGAKDEDTGKAKAEAESKSDGVDKAMHIATFSPPPAPALPAGVSVKAMFNAAGLVFVTDAGKPLYVFDGDANGKATCSVGDCLNQWTPFVAARIAKGNGDFSVVHGDDGVDQWAYRGWPLYTFNGDVSAIDVRGEQADRRWHVVKQASYYMPPGTSVGLTPYGGTYLKNGDGMTLYVRDRFNGEHQGHSIVAGFRGMAPYGRQYGTSTCDAECTKTWRPFQPPAGAQPGGFWEILTRADGTKQWSYNGYALYTFVGDKAPGDLKGNDTVDLFALADDPFGFVEADNPQQSVGTMYWHAIAP